MIYEKPGFSMEHSEPSICVAMYIFPLEAVFEVAPNMSYIMVFTPLCSLFSLSEVFPVNWLLMKRIQQQQKRI